MSYELHITKAENWWESSKQPIKLEKILELVNSNPYFRLENQSIVRNPITWEAASIPGKFIVWEKEGEEIWCKYTGEEVVAHCYCEEDIENLKYIAKLLSAKIQGDEGEFY